MAALERTAFGAALKPTPGTPIPSDCDQRITALYRYWQMKRPGAGLLPGRQHIWPAEVPGLLRYVWLCDVEREPLRFRYRLIGSTISYLMSRDETGAWLDEAHENFESSPAYRDFVAAVETAAGVYYKGKPLFHLEKDYIAMERLLLPMARNGYDVDMLLGITLYEAAAADATTARLAEGVLDA